MNSKKKRTRNKSGFLTGLMIVSTGLIAGFQGFDLAMSDEDKQQLQSTSATRQDDQRSASAVGRQVSALDQLITASLEGKTPDAGSIDSQGLANLIRAAQNETSIDPRSQKSDLATANEYPVVNRALKQDRAQSSGSIETPEGERKGLTSFIEAGNGSLKQDTVGNFEQRDAEQQNSAAGKKAGIARRNTLTQADHQAAAPAINSDIPLADSADIALFAADMPLPAKLTKVATRSNNGLPLLARAHRTPYNRSPLVPRKYVSGKAFGGLAERAFQKRERRCMTTALYFEARSEPEAGQIAVGQVVMNRVRSPDYPDTICGVVYQGSHRRTGCQFSFTCDGKADKPNNKKQWERSKRLANQVLEGRAWLKSIGNATHYHATYVSPRWRRKMARLKQIGRHIFYKSPNISVTHTYQRYISGKRS